MAVIGSAGVLAPGKWRPLRALGWLLLLCILIVLAYNLVAKAVLMLLAPVAGFDSSEAPAAWKLVASVLGSAALIAAYWGAVRFGERRNVPELALRRAPWELLLGLGGVTDAVCAAAEPQVPHGAEQEPRELARPLLVAPVADPHDVAVQGAGGAGVEHPRVGRLVPRPGPLRPPPRQVEVPDDASEREHAVEVAEVEPRHRRRVGGRRDRRPT